MIRRTFFKSMAAAVMLAVGAKLGFLERLAPTTDVLDGVFQSELTLEYGVVADAIYQIDPVDTPFFQMLETTPLFKSKWEAVRPLVPFEVNDRFATWLGVPKSWLRIAKKKTAMMAHLNQLMAKKIELGEEPPSVTRSEVLVDHSLLRRAWLGDTVPEPTIHNWQFRSLTPRQ